ncbi:hypothetical protein JOL79_28805 [Microbispora sp. RL4-1S]|uniref:Uncharacterized protein n=1 Tax=Microbispora oryzae TaxID=2806554 RepID=A0A941ALZ3_9ACTN|nr:hypothetical protein [Microbispora oryzae]MBP2707787.1 hypothetical protein [Microbispora oryzae]
MFNPTIEVIVAQPRFRQPPDMSFNSILKRFPGLAEADAVCWTGSTAIGWGNVFSDYDLFAFSDRTLELPVDETMEAWPGVDKSGIRWDNWMGEYEKARVDLTVWPTGTFAKVLQPYLDDELELCGTSEGMLAFVYRMSIAIPLKNDSFFKEARELLDRSSFRRARARTAKVWAENSLTDVAGQLDAGDQASARISARVAAFRAADACLALYGDYCHDEKWTMRRLRSKPECGIDADEFRSAVLDGARPGESDGDCALRVARWAQGHLVRLEGEFLTGS